MLRTLKLGNGTMKSVKLTESIIERCTTWIKVIFDLEPKDVGIVFDIIDLCSNQHNEQRKQTFKCTIKECEHRKIDNFYKQQLGPPDYCYAGENNCNSMFIFLCSISPHFPFRHQVVGKIYRLQ